MPEDGSAPRLGEIAGEVLRIRVVDRTLGREGLVPTRELVRVEEGAARCADLEREARRVLARERRSKPGSSKT